MRECKTIAVPLADLATKPQSCSQDFSHDPVRNSQLLFGETVEIIKEDSWCYVYAPMQGLFGYLPKSVLTHHEEMTHVIDSFDHELPYGSFAKEGRLLSEPLCRKKLVADAYHFLGMPYLWGGCSNHRTKPIGSVDCSALIHLLFRAQGVLIPRDSGPQAEFAKKREVLLPGDLIYLGGHVIMKLEKDLFIEAPQTGQSVRLLKWGRDVWEDGGIRFFDREKCYEKKSCCLAD